MRKRPGTMPLVVICAALTMGNDGCNQDTQQKSGSGAKQVSLEQIPRNSRGNTVEQQSILDRNRVTQDPTKVMWIHLIALDGQIVKRMPVRNKVTSSGKRLEPKHAASNVGGYPDTPFSIAGSSFKWKTDEFIQADGTYGESDPYIYWFDPPGRYHQWGTAGGLGYLLTDYPIDLVDPQDLATGMYKMDAAAHKWQKEQEATLVERESSK